MELTFRLNRNGVASLDSAEVMLEDRIEFEKCEIVKPPAAPKVNVTTTSNATKKEKSDSTPPTETDENASKEQPKDDDSKTKGDEEGKRPEDSSEQSDGSSDQAQEPKTDAGADEPQVKCVHECVLHAGSGAGTAAPPSISDAIIQVDVTAENAAFLQILLDMQQTPDVVTSELNTDGSRCAACCFAAGFTVDPGTSPLFTVGPSPLSDQRHLLRRVANVRTTLFQESTRRCR
jgi:hypothetical protein